MTRVSNCGCKAALVSNPATTLSYQEMRRRRRACISYKDYEYCLPEMLGNPGRAAKTRANPYSYRYPRSSYYSYPIYNYSAYPFGYTMYQDGCTWTWTQTGWRCISGRPYNYYDPFWPWYYYSNYYGFGSPVPVVQTTTPAATTPYSSAAANPGFPSARRAFNVAGCRYQPQASFSYAGAPAGRNPNP
jgi:hypothetical protein